MVTALSIAKRKLVYARFFSWTLPENCGYKLEDYGGYIGVYDSGSGRIFFFEDGFVVGESCEDIIYYLCYMGNEGPFEKTDVRGFTVLVNDGRRVWLPVSGFNPPKFWDAFTILSYIMHVSGFKKVKLKEAQARRDGDIQET